MAGLAPIRLKRHGRGATDRLIRGACLFVFSLALTAGAGSAPALAAEPGVGLGEIGPAQVANVKTLGVRWVRRFISWRELQPTPAPVSNTILSAYEHQFQELPPGTKIILDVVDTPQWETGSADEHAPPADPGDYAAFVATLAARWGKLVSAYEIWNEEDAPRWWTGAPDPAGYTALLKAAYPAIKAADPSAVVILGGLTGNDFQFLEGVYAAGGKGFFDAVGVHTDTACNILSPYEFLREPDHRMVPDSFLAYREVRAVMLANGDDKPIWMTELSWRTTDALCPEGAWAGQKPEGVTDEQQATYLSQAYHCLAEDPYVQVALWFPLYDEGPVVSGLVRENGSRKPSFTAMRDYVKYGDRVSEPCGTFSGPRITVDSPYNHVAYSGPLPIHVVASSPEGVYRITLEIDGKTIRNYGDATSHPSLTGVIDWQGAKHISYGWHTLTFLAYDKELNVSHVSIRIDHLFGGSGYGSPPALPRVKGSHHAVGKPKSKGKPHHKTVRPKRKHHGHHHG